MKLQLQQQQEGQLAKNLAVVRQTVRQRQLSSWLIQQSS
jgi:hypothetical protein